jgi:ABC-type uncharacterized transport system ATPase subunit
MRVLDEMPEVEKTSVFGASVHAVLREQQDDASRLRARLAAKGVAITSIEQVAPSLEDVFLDVAAHVS